VHEERAAARLQDLEQRRAALPALALGQRGGRQREADQAAGQHRVEGGGVGLDERRAGPGRQPAAELQRALVVGVGDRGGLVGRQALDADGAARRDDREVDAVAVHERQTGLDVVVAGADRA
jgi:hypothetical protein